MPTGCFQARPSMNSAKHAEGAGTGCGADRKSRGPFNSFLASAKVCSEMVLTDPEGSGRRARGFLVRCVPGGGIRMRAEFPKRQISGCAARIAGIRARIGTACFVFVLLSWTAEARPVVCRDAVGTEAKEAVTAAEAHIARLWLAMPGQLVLAYRLKGEEGPGASNPSSGGGGLLFAKPARAPETTAIEGLLSVDKLDCSIYEIGPPRAFVVGFTGRGLTFKEGGESWSPRLPEGLVHVLAVRRHGSGWTVSPMPGARTSLPDDAMLSRPTGLANPPPASRSGRP